MNLMLIDMTPLEDLFVDIFSVDPIVLRLLPTPLQPLYIGVTAADVVGTELAVRTIEAGGVGAIDLFTPEIRRYEDTALVGMGVKII